MTTGTSTRSWASDEQRNHCNLSNGRRCLWRSRRMGHRRPDRSRYRPDQWPARDPRRLHLRAGVPPMSKSTDQRTVEAYEKATALATQLGKYGELDQDKLLEQAIEIQKLLEFVDGSESA